MTARPEQIHSNETFFPITAKYLEKCVKRNWDTSCSFCREPFLVGHVCHSKFNGIKYKKRHMACAFKVGLVTKEDAQMAIMGYGKMNKLDIQPVKPQLVKVNV